MQFEKHNHFALCTLHFAFSMGGAVRNVRAANDRPYTPVARCLLPIHEPRFPEFNCIRHCKYATIVATILHRNEVTTYGSK